MPCGEAGDFTTCRTALAHRVGFEPTYTCLDDNPNLSVVKFWWGPEGSNLGQPVRTSLCIEGRPMRQRFHPVLYLLS